MQNKNNTNTIPEVNVAPENVDQIVKARNFISELKSVEKSIPFAADVLDDNLNPYRNAFVEFCKNNLAFNSAPTKVSHFDDGLRVEFYTGKSLDLTGDVYKALFWNDLFETLYMH